MWRKRYHVCATQSLSISMGIRMASSSGTLNGGKDGPWVKRNSLELGAVCRRRHLHSAGSERKFTQSVLIFHFNGQSQKNSLQATSNCSYSPTWRSGRMPLGSTAPPRAGGVSSWPASPVPSSSTAAWGSSGRTPAATPQTAPPSVSPPASPPRRLKTGRRVVNHVPRKWLGSTDGKSDGTSDGGRGQ